MDPAIASWRRQRRQELLEQRQTLSGDARRTAAAAIAVRLNDIVAAVRPATIGLYWPIRQEINLLSWASELSRQSGLVMCLPVVVTPKAPLEYWRWTPDEPLAHGFWNIPVPQRRDVVLPDIMLAPLVGFDAADYRLGYGGGYFDRTLASLPVRPTVLGVGYEFSAIETISPQPHDIPMDGVVTEHRDTSRSGRRMHDDRS